MYIHNIHSYIFLSGTPSDGISISDNDAICDINSLCVAQKGSQLEVFDPTCYGQRTPLYDIIPSSNPDSPLPDDLDSLDSNSIKVDSGNYAAFALMEDGVDLACQKVPENGEFLTFSCTNRSSKSTYHIFIAFVLGVFLNSYEFYVSKYLGLLYEIYVLNFYHYCDKSFLRFVENVSSDLN